MLLRESTLALALGGLLWFSFGQDSSAKALAQRTFDVVDSRPSRSILILGNSRTYYNDMPAMLREIADSAGSPTKFQIETNAKPGFTLGNHWSDERAKRLLGDGWDEVIIQGESGAQASREQSESFQAHGAKLARLANLHSGRPTLIVNWPYDRSAFEGYEDYDRAEHLAFLREVHASLARKAGLERINLASLWESVSRAHPSVKLTTDGNHPTVAGSYLYALAVYRHLSDGPVGHVTYAPDSLNRRDAEALRHAVDSFSQLVS